jgi:hypothetical protein
VRWTCATWVVGLALRAAGRALLAPPPAGRHCLSAAAGAGQAALLPAPAPPHPAACPYSPGAPPRPPLPRPAGPRAAVHAQAAAQLRGLDGGDQGAGALQGQVRGWAAGGRKIKIIKNLNNVCPAGAGGGGVQCGAHAWSGAAVAAAQQERPAAGRRPAATLPLHWPPPSRVASLAAAVLSAARCALSAGGPPFAAAAAVDEVHYVEDVAAVLAAAGAPQLHLLQGVNTDRCVRSQPPSLFLAAPAAGCCGVARTEQPGSRTKRSRTRASLALHVPALWMLWAGAGQAAPSGAPL